MLFCCGSGAITSDKPDKMDAQVRKVTSAFVSIPLPAQGVAAAHQASMHSGSFVPAQCFELTFSNRKTWDRHPQARINSDGKLILRWRGGIWCFGIGL